MLLLLAQFRPYEKPSPGLQNDVHVFWIALFLLVVLLLYVSWYSASRRGPRS